MAYLGKKFDLIGLDDFDLTIYIKDRPSIKRPVASFYRDKNNYYLQFYFPADIATGLWSAFKIRFKDKYHSALLKRPIFKDRTWGFLSNRKGEFDTCIVAFRFNSRSNRIHLLPS